MLELFGRLLLMPFMMFANGLEAIARAVQNMERQAELTMSGMRNSIDPYPGTTPGEGFVEAEGNRRLEPSSLSTRKEERKMGDRNLSDDMVKLVQWSLVSVKRDGEQVFTQGEDLVTDNLTPDGFTAWIVRKYGCDAVPLGDAMYIRVYYNVLDRWAKQDLHFESRQLAALERIADCVCLEKGREGGESAETTGGGGRGRRGGGEAGAAAT